MSQILACCLALAVFGAGLYAADAQVPPKKTLGVTEIQKAVADLGSEDFKTRQAAEAALTTAGESARSALETAIKLTKDGEVRSRSQRLIKRLNDVRDYAALSDEKKEIVKRPFKRTYTEGNEVMAALYPDGKFTLCEIANVRLAFEDQVFEGSQESSIRINGNDEGEGGGGSDDFSNWYVNGVESCDFHGIRWTISKGVLKIGDKEISIGGKGTQTIFVAKDGKVQQVVEVPGKDQPKDKADAQK